jgi:CelD/BcsL family acetyltransferase involved in cellulose biosynthesis
VELLETLADFETLASCWNGLLARSLNNRLFVTWEWMHAWVQEYVAANPHRHLFVLRVLQGENLLGIAPFYIDDFKKVGIGFRQIRFIGHPEAGSDYLDVIAVADKERAVAETIYQFLSQCVSKRWDQLVLAELPSESRFLLHLVNAIESEGRFFEFGLAAYCPQTLLSPESDPLKGISANARQQFRRHRRVLNEDYRAVSYRPQGSEAIQRLAEFFEFFQRVTPHPEGGLQGLLSRLASHGSDAIELRIDVVQADDRWTGALLHLCYRDAWYMYLMAVDKAAAPHISLGTVLIGQALETAREQGAKRYDFLKGSEPYKFRWASTGERTVRLTLPGRGYRATLLSWMGLLKSAAKVLLR